MKAPRCEATKAKDLVMALISNLNQAPTVSRCDKPAGHAGPHSHRYQPFPGFADQIDVWYTEDLTVEVPDAAVRDADTDTDLGSAPRDHPG